MALESTETVTEMDAGKVPEVRSGQQVRLTTSSLSVCPDVSKP
jgi:hypothetical protein